MQVLSTMSCGSSCAGAPRAGTSNLKLARSSSQLKLRRRKQLPGRLQFGNATVPPSLNWADLGAVSSVKDQGTSVAFWAVVVVVGAPTYARCA
jgi:C1A family cysteine protease